MTVSCAHLTGPVLGNNFDVNFGFLHDRLEVEHGGPSATRPPYAGFLREVSLV